MSTAMLPTDPTDFTNACPSWCTLRPGHPADSIHDDGRESRGHGGEDFGEFLHPGAYEFTDEPGVLLCDVQLHAEAEPLQVEQLRDLARNALDAAAWLEAHR